MEERLWCCCGFGCRHGFALSFCSGGEVSDLSGDGKIDGDSLNEPPAAPPRVSPSPTPPSID